MSDGTFGSPPGRASAHGRTRYVVTAGLLAALLASAAWISFPVGTVPFTLQVFVVVLAALLLPPSWTIAAISVYLLLGALGVPVFAGARGGLGVLFGPTGGYLFGFLVAAPIGALLRRLLVDAGVMEVLAGSIAALATVLVIYAAGWAQLAIVTGAGVGEAFLVGVAPFVAFDVAKAAAAVAVASALRRAGVVR